MGDGSQKDDVYIQVPEALADGHETLSMRSEES